MEEKRVKAPLEVKRDGDEGSVEAAFSVFNVIDSDGDVVLPTAFEDGQAVPMVWSHQWTSPVGKGSVRVEKGRAVFDGRFFLDTQAGAEAYKTVRNMAELQEWSFGFQVLDAEADAEFDGTEGVRLLKKLQLFEVSPVLVGANRETVTLAIKAGGEAIYPRYAPFDFDEKPYANEHACRLEDPGKFIRFRRDNDADPNRIYGFLSGGGSRIQAYRYPTSRWTAARARKHCRDHDGAFEAAKAAMLENARAWLEYLAQEGPGGKQPGDWLQEADRLINTEFDEERERAGAVP